MLPLVRAPAWAQRTSHARESEAGSSRILALSAAVSQLILGD